MVTVSSRRRGAARRTMERNWKWHGRAHSPQTEQHVLRILCAKERRRSSAAHSAGASAAAGRLRGWPDTGQPSLSAHSYTHTHTRCSGAVLCTARCAYRSYPWQRPASAADGHVPDLPARGFWSARNSTFEMYFTLGLIIYLKSFCCINHGLALINFLCVIIMFVCYFLFSVLVIILSNWMLFCLQTSLMRGPTTWEVVFLHSVPLPIFYLDSFPRCCFNCAVFGISLFLVLSKILVTSYFSPVAPHNVTKITQLLTIYTLLVNKFICWLDTLSQPCLRTLFQRRVFIKNISQYSKVLIYLTTSIILFFIEFATSAKHTVHKKRNVSSLFTCITQK